jgi:hypothetical protein
VRPILFLSATQLTASVTLTTWRGKQLEGGPGDYVYMKGVKATTAYGDNAGIDLALLSTTVTTVNPPDNEDVAPLRAWYAASESESSSSSCAPPDDGAKCDDLPAAITVST